MIRCALFGLACAAAVPVLLCAALYLYAYFPPWRTRADAGTDIRWPT